jgi:16S rRNA (guanine966-N2)-methyltransferase
VRILSGEFHGRILEQPKSRQVRPLAGKVRGALFDVLGPVNGLTVLDAYAGSGAAGMEAASRGAMLVEAIEANAAAARTIQRNATALGLGVSYILHQVTVESWLALPAQQPPQERYDVIIADPPYAKLDSDVVRRLAAYLVPGGILILSHSSRVPSPALTGVVLHAHKVYGDTALSFYSNTAV